MVFKKYQNIQWYYLIFFTHFMEATFSQVRHPSHPGRGCGSLTCHMTHFEQSDWLRSPNLTNIMIEWLINTRGAFLHPDSMILDPFEINYDKDQINEYYGELDPDRNDLMNICSIRGRKILKKSYTVLCQGCQRKIHRNCTALSHEEFLLIQDCTTWFCRLCNESLFPFNHIDYEYELTITLDQLMSGSLIPGVHFFILTPWYLIHSK